jgi:hypothetical protein
LATAFLISEGLASCRYGVVVLSPAFFEKKWPQAELNGLFALEEKKRKIILPVWKDISEEAIKRYSPILADRIASIASNGIETVTRELQKSIDVSERTRDITSTNPVIERARSLDANLRQKANAEKLSRSVEGVTLVTQSFDKLHETMKAMTAEITTPSTLLRLTIHGSQALGQLMFRVNTSQPLSMLVTLIGVGGNFTNDSELIVAVHEKDSWGDQGDVIQELRFKPTFLISNEVVWVSDSDDKKHSAEQLAERVLQILMDELERSDQNL